MTVISSRDRRWGHGLGATAARAGLAIVTVVGLLLVTACGMSAQTLKPYTPAEGINFDVGATRTTRALSCTSATW